MVVNCLTEKILCFCVMSVYFYGIVIKLPLLVLVWLIIFECFSGVVCQVGEEHEAVVLFVDTEADCVQLSLNQEFVTAVKKFIDNKYSKVGMPEYFIQLNFEYWDNDTGTV